VGGDPHRAGREECKLQQRTSVTVGLFGESVPVKRFCDRREGAHERSRVHSGLEKSVSSHIPRDGGAAGLKSQRDSACECV
jgi:hypothetical protein